MNGSGIRDGRGQLRPGEGWLYTPEELQLRAREEAVYLTEQNATVRSVAAHFGVSKSTVHKDVTERLGESDAVLREQVAAVLRENKAVRHLRGGEATRQRYAKKERS